MTSINRHYFEKMTLKSDLKTLILTSLISTIAFFIFGNIIFNGLINYGDWVLVLFPVHIIVSFIIMTPLLLIFWYLDRYQNKKLKSVIIKVGLRTTIGTLYITALLWFSIFSDTRQRLKDPFNYYEDLKYLGLCTLITILTFAFLDYFQETKKRKMTTI